MPKAPQYSGKIFYKTVTSAVLLKVGVLQWVSWKATLESVLPKFWEPGISCVLIQMQFQKIVIKGQDFWRLQLDCDASVCLSFIPFNDFISICPSVTGREKQKLFGRARNGCRNTSRSYCIAWFCFLF